MLQEQTRICASEGAGCTLSFPLLPLHICREVQEGFWCALQKLPRCCPN